MIGRRFIQLAPPGASPPIAAPAGDAKLIKGAVLAVAPPALIRTWPKPRLRSPEAISPERAVLSSMASLLRQPFHEPEAGVSTHLSRCAPGCQRAVTHVGNCWTADGLAPPSVKKAHKILKMKSVDQERLSRDAPTPTLKRARDDDDEDSD